jgi:5-methylcytosine-specific restriction endonuclease McrA
MPRLSHSPAPKTFYASPRTRSDKAFGVTTAHKASPQPSYYKSGLPKHRSEEAKKQFLRQHGLKRVPSGMEVDHRVPLAAGGADKPSNMQLIPKSTHAAKTAAEAKRYGWHKKR